MTTDRRPFAVRLVGFPAEAERVLAQLVRRSRHRFTILNNHYEPARTFPELSDCEVVELPWISVERRLVPTIEAIATLLVQRLPLADIDALMVSAESVGELVTLLHRRLPPCFAYCHTPLRVAFDDVLREIAQHLEAPSNERSEVGERRMPDEARCPARDDERQAGKREQLVAEPGFLHEEPEDHEHGAGPHGGAVGHFGKYHFEFTVNHKTQEATVYILDGDATKAAPIKVATLTLSIFKPMFRVELKPVPQEGDPKGSSSRFSGKHEKFGVEQEFAGELSGDVDGRSLSGDFEEKPEKK